jgi:type III pantothenate kinase
MSGVLVLDRGNYSLKGALIESGTIVKRWERRSIDERGAIGEILNSSSPEGVAFSSVVPRWTSSFIGELRKRGIEQVVEVSAGISLPFRLLVEEPEKVGPDRLSAAAGAVDIGKREAIIVDAGTAVTVDSLSSQGFMGGAIFPGIDLIVRSLHVGTAVLPLIGNDSETITLPGRNTEEAIKAGTVWGLIGAVKELVQQSRKSLSSSAAILVTGGGAGAIAPYLAESVSLEPDLIFNGMHHLFKLNTA